MPEPKDRWSGSILDAPEPVRSQSLARMGMTEAEFIAHQAGCKALVAEAQARYERGETTASGSEGDDEDIDVKSASISVVKDWPGA